jgi:hypothetical protein
LSIVVRKEKEKNSKPKVSNMKLQEFPDRIYTVSHQGWLSVMIKLIPKNIRNCATQEGEMPYTYVSMLCRYSDEPWSLQDYEADIAKVLKAQRVCYSCLTLDFINSMIEGTSEYQGSDVWTLDINKAIEVSKERYVIYHPHGKAYDVVSYWDDCDRKVLNAEPLLYSEAQKLLGEYNSTKRYGSLYYYGVEVHKEDKK